MLIRALTKWAIKQYEEAQNQYEKTVPFPHSMTVMAVAGKIFAYIAQTSAFHLLSLPNDPCSQDEKVVCAVLTELPGILHLTADVFLTVCTLSSFIHIYMEKTFKGEAQINLPQ